MAANALELGLNEADETCLTKLAVGANNKRNVDRVLRGAICLAPGEGRDETPIQKLVKVPCALDQGPASISTET